MLEWLTLSRKRKNETLIEANRRTGLPAQAIEKDWWVTIALKAAFTTTWANNLVFKGGTSLSKSWKLIERFSEDIDLAIDRKVLGFSDQDDLSKSQIKKLRKVSCSFVSNEFKDDLRKQLISDGVDQSLFDLSARPAKESDTDPQILELSYKSVHNADKEAYISSKVLLEIGARSLHEPSQQRLISSILDEAITGHVYSGTVKIDTVEPRRTFLEKAFLLHEEFQKAEGKIRCNRMSRHLYDLERLMDTEHGLTALTDTKLYQLIVSHRQKFNLQPYDYTSHHPKLINFIPSDAHLKSWEDDYKNMTTNMIYGNALSFEVLMKRLQDLQSRFRSISL